MHPRSFYSFETPELDASPNRERSTFLHQSQKEKADGWSDPLTSKKSKSKQSKHLSRELSGKNLIEVFLKM